jgi:hypothetical protein
MKLSFFASILFARLSLVAQNYDEMSGEKSNVLVFCYSTNVSSRSCHSKKIASTSNFENRQLRCGFDALKARIARATQQGQWQRPPYKSKQASVAVLSVKQFLDRTREEDEQPALGCELQGHDLDGKGYNNRMVSVSS